MVNTKFRRINLEILHTGCACSSGPNSLCQLEPYIFLLLKSEIFKDRALSHSNWDEYETDVTDVTSLSARGPASFFSCESSHTLKAGITKANLSQRQNSKKRCKIGGVQMCYWFGLCSDVSRKGGILRASSMCSVFLCENNPNQPSAVLLDVFSLKALTGASLTLWLPSFPATDLELTSESRVSHFVIRGFFSSLRSFYELKWKETSSNVIALFHLPRRGLNGGATRGRRGAVTT